MKMNISKNLLLIIADKNKLTHLKKDNYREITFYPKWTVIIIAREGLWDHITFIKQECKKYETIYIILRLSSSPDYNGDLSTDKSNVPFSDILNIISRLNELAIYHIFAINCRGFFLHKCFQGNSKIKSIITLADYCSGVKKHDLFSNIIPLLLDDNRFSFCNLITEYLTAIKPYVPVIFISYFDKNNNAILYTPLIQLKARFYANPLYDFYIEKDYNSFQAFINTNYKLSQEKIAYYFKILNELKKTSELKVLAEFIEDSLNTRQNPLLYRDPYTLYKLGFSLDFKALAMSSPNNFKHNSRLYIPEPSNLYYEHLMYYNTSTNIITMYIDKDIILYNRK